MPLVVAAPVTSDVSGGEVEQLTTPIVATIANVERETHDKTIETLLGAPVQPNDGCPGFEA
jgi:hypothetical protein